MADNMKQTQLQADIVELLKLALEQGSSDLLLTVGLPPMLRIDGEWQPTQYDTLQPNYTRRLMYSMMDEKKQRQFEEDLDLDFSFSLSGEGRFRVNAFMQKGSVGGVLRLISEEILTFGQLGLPDTIADVARLPRSLILVTGPTGSGKSTTLATMVDLINSESRKHIVTIEDPVEFFHSHRSSIVNQREVNADTHSFEAALRSVLRQAPDVILVGELRDHTTIGAAVTAAETGHLVLGTLHTNSAPEAVDRIIDVFPEAQQAQVRVQLASNLQAILTQQLVPRTGGGRVLAYEFLMVTPAVRNLIREGKTHMILSQMQMGGQLGMITMDAHLAELHLKRIISFETGRSRAVDAKEFERLVETGGVTGDASRSPSGRPPGMPGPQTPAADTGVGRPTAPMGRTGRGT
jgi:twitching motility protein PilT